MNNIKLLRSITILLCLISNISCQNQPTDDIGTYLKLDSNFEKFKAIVVIPNQGCTGCISEAENYVIENAPIREDVVFVFTQIQSLKLLRVKLGNEILKLKNVIFDSENSIKYPDENKIIYPMIIIVNHGKIKKITYQSPTKEALKELSKS
jgi:hypothetical protein